MSDSNSALPSILEYSEDVSAAEAPPPLPARIYPAQVVSATQKISKTSGNAYVALVVKVSADAHPVDYPGNPDGTTLTFNRVVINDTYEGRWRMRLLCEALGVVPSRRVDLNKFVGAACRVEVTNEPYEGVMRHQANNILHP
jgi:hypothetical protein